MALTLSGKAAVIAGAGRGIGRAITLALPAPNLDATRSRLRTVIIGASFKDLHWNVRPVSPLGIPTIQLTPWIGHRFSYNGPVRPDRTRIRSQWASCTVQPQPHEIKLDWQASHGL